MIPAVQGEGCASRLRDSRATRRGAFYECPQSYRRDHVAPEAAARPRGLRRPRSHAHMLCVLALYRSGTLI